MTEQEKKMSDEKEKPREEATPPTVDEAQRTDDAGGSEIPPAVEEPEAPTHGLSEKRGRLVAAGMVATVVVALVALAVAGIVQLTSKWLVVCPTDLPVNDPAPILWKTVVTDDVKAQSLGVPGKLMAEARFKQ